MITSNQFSINLIPEFFKPSGPILEKNQLSEDNRRPLLNCKITQGFRISDLGKVEIELEGLRLLPSKNIFNQECFDFNCFEEEGLYSYVKGISDICLVAQNNSLPNKLMTAEERRLLNKSCFIDNTNNSTFFIRGTKDINNTVYSADIGTVNLTSGSVSIIDENVPFFSSSKSNSLFALSPRKIGRGVKIAIIKKITKTNVETIGTIYGELENEFYFPHTTLIKNRKYTSKGQKLNLEN